MKGHVYVLGSNSFSGAHFVRHALQQGFAVTGVSRSPEANPVFLPYLDDAGKHPEGFSFLQADLNHDLDALRARMDEDRPDYVVNFAAQGMVAESWLHPEQWLRTNALSPLLLYEYLRKCSWLKKFVQISTPEVYGSTEGLIKESTVYNPSTPYAVSKATADMNLMCFFRAYNFPVVFTRAANVYGAGQQLYRIIPRVALRFLTGETVELHGGGTSVRSFIHISDVCNATWQIMRDAAPGEIFHIASSDVVSIRELVMKIAEIMRVNPERQVVSVGERLGKDSAYLLDTSKLRQTFAWEPAYNLHDGIVDVLTWVRKNLPVLTQLPQNYQHKA